jgi:hypothetical protein
VLLQELKSLLLVVDRGSQGFGGTVACLDQRNLGLPICGHVQFSEEKDQDNLKKKQSKVVKLSSLKLCKMHKMFECLFFIFCKKKVLFYKRLF